MTDGRKLTRQQELSKNGNMLSCSELGTTGLLLHHRDYNTDRGFYFDM